MVYLRVLVEKEFDVKFNMVDCDENFITTAGLCSAVERRIKEEN